MDDIRQLKLSTGDDVVCQVIQWADDENADIVVRHAYKIVSKSDGGYRYYTFVPWMVYQTGDEMFVTINCIHVVGDAKPHDNVLVQFMTALEQERKAVADENEVQSLSPSSAEDLQRLLDMMKSTTEQSDLSYTQDSDSKVITFPNNGKIH